MEISKSYSHSAEDLDRGTTMRGAFFVIQGATTCFLTMTAIGSRNSNTEPTNAAKTAAGVAGGDGGSSTYPAPAAVGGKGKENGDSDDDGRPVNEVDYRGEGGPFLKYLWCDESSDGESAGNQGNGSDGPDNGGEDQEQQQEQQLSERQLYLGAEIGVEGVMYCIPGHASRVLTCDPSRGGGGMAKLIGPSIPGKSKWVRGVRVGDVIYGLPCHADTVLKIHVPTQTVSTLPIDYEGFYSAAAKAKTETDGGGDPENSKAQQQRRQEWKYHGGTISPVDGRIYCIPQSALHVLQIDPSTEVCRLVGPEFVGRWKWYGGIVGKQDDAIHGIPHSSSSVLRILPDRDGGGNDVRITLHGDYGTGEHKWRGAAAAPNGDIVSVPANADTVLVIRPGLPEPSLFELGDPSVVRTGRHCGDSNYKYLGAIEGTDGMVYCFPGGSERVLQVDTTKQTVRQVGPSLFDNKMERLWQSGLVSAHEQCVYAIPLAAESLLRIDCSEEAKSKNGGEPEITTWELPVPHRGLSSKWEGGIVAPNGVIYTVPNNHKAILRIESFRRGHPGSGASGETMLREKPTGAENLPYGSGIPTLRSSAHRVKSKNRKHNPKPKNRDGVETGTLWLPPELLDEDVFHYDESMHRMMDDAVRSLLQKCDPTIVGSFRDGSDGHLEDFVVPVKSTWRKVNGGQCEKAQKYLSDRVVNDKEFLAAFDRLVQEVVLPYLKRRLVEVGAATDEAGSVTFYYQRPPTLRLQPGPAWAQVKAHNDAEYGHQNGELVR